MPMAIVLKLSVIVVLCLICLVIVRFGFGRAIKNTKNLNIKFFKSVIEVIILLIGIYNCLSCFDTTKEISKTLLQSSALILAIATFAAHSLTCETLPGLLSTSSVAMVWMESMTTGALTLISLAFTPFASRN